MCHGTIDDCRANVLSNNEPLWTHGGTVDGMTVVRLLVTYCRIWLRECYAETAGNMAVAICKFVFLDTFFFFLF